MQELLRRIAAWRDVPIEDGTELHVELAGFPSGGLGLLVLVGILLSLALVVYAYRRESRNLSGGRRGLLMVLRMVAVLLAVVLLLDPQLVAVRREVQPGHTILLVDTSQSMGHRDAYERPAVESLATGWKGLGIADPAITPRIELVRALLAHGDGELLERLRSRNKVLVYGFGAALEPLGSLEFQNPATAARATAAPNDQEDPAVDPIEAFDPETLAASGTYSNLGGAVRAALGRSGSANVAGVVLITDGRRNLGPQGPEVARMLKNRGVPTTVVVPVGDPSPVQTLRIERLDAPEKVFQKDPFEISAVVEAQGYGDLEFPVHLVRTDAANGDPVTIRTETARILAGTPETTVRFGDLRSEVTGVATWSVVIEPPRFEAESDERHVRRARIEVLGEKTRVLLLAGGPSHEYRILRNLLTRDDTIELSCWLTSADPDFPQDGNVSLEKLPATREEMEDFDVFILLDPDSSKLTPEWCEAVAEQIRENGAGMWWGCGEKYTLDALREGATTAPLAELLPVIPDVQEADTRIGLARGMPRAFRYQLTTDGTTHKATRVAEDRAESETIWARLPGFYFVFPVERAKPGAQVLVEHEQPGAAGSGPFPLLASGFVGSGRVLFCATDDTYRWRTTFENAYDRFWVKGIRYLFEGRLGAGNSRVRIEVDEETVELGQPQRVIVELRDEAFEPLVVDGHTVLLEDEDGVGEELALEPVEGVPGQYQAWIRPTRTGWFRVAPTEEGDGPAAEATFQVVPAALEKEGPSDLPELTAIAAAPGGVLVARPDEALTAIDAIRAETRIEPYTNSRTLWDSWWTLGALTLVLALEWWIRKRSNLL